MNITDKDLQKIIGARTEIWCVNSINYWDFWRSNLLIRASTRHGAFFYFLKKTTKISFK